ncbi:hypothetical protein ACFQ1M_06095 [Sungkyunkwania multivorans]|uniref:Uncharacterized protein n=1 Tax=Sungkyunkwania multivorans TaxID=1173618 RepID=A0ABW3CVH1_9FLAO
MKTINIITILLLISFTSCVQDIHQKTVTFRVDMNAVENVKNVGVRGNFTNPTWGRTIPLEDPDGDGIYEGTFSKKAAADNISFKFVNQNDQFELNGQDNRSIQFEYKPETITYEAVFDKAEGKIIK